jgi:osmotically inducible lipoprotein OsmB
MTSNSKSNRLIAVFLAIVLTLLTVAPGSVAFADHIRRRPSKTKNIAVGTAIGAVGGALIGGRKGALIGAGGGAGAGYLFYRHKKHKYNKQYQSRYYRYTRAR